MAQDTILSVTPYGNKSEQKTFDEVSTHYHLARNDLDSRIGRKNGFDDADKLYFGVLPDDWPFQAKIFDKRLQTVVNEKDARLIGGKPKGRFLGREGSDEIGAFVFNELYNFQWDDLSRVGLPLIVRWALMSQQARRYGISFAVCKWLHKERNSKEIFDGPDFKVIYGRDALPNPAYSEVKNWFQYREWVTLVDLETQNDTSPSINSKWKNLEKIREIFSQTETVGKGDSRSASYTIKAKTLRGITDSMGQDPVFRVFEIIHELREDHWITFAPRLGIILRDISNPYNHSEIPVIALRYNPILDDLYGVSEMESGSDNQRAINALLCADIDAIVTDLYPPLMINPAGVKMHTIEFKSDAKWLMTRPGQDVQRMQTSTPGVREFVDAYALLVASLNNTLGETTAGFSSLQPLGEEKTATEVRETAITRNVRDNYNQIMLAEALKKQAYFWLEMDKQFLFKNPQQQVKVIRIVGRDAVTFFQSLGMNKYQTDELGNILPDGGPKFPVTLADGTIIPQFEPSIAGQQGDLYVTKKDLSGIYDFIPDVESMQVASEQQMEAKLNIALQLLTNSTIVQLMAAEGKKPRVTELLIKLLETTRVIKNAEQYFENIPNQEQSAVPGAIVPLQEGVTNGQVRPGGTQGIGGGGGFSSPVSVPGIPNISPIP